MITVLSNLIGLIPINHAFMVEKNPFRGNVYLLLYTASLMRHSTLTENVPVINKFIERIDKFMVWSTLTYNTYTKPILLLPYSILFLTYYKFIIKKPRTIRKQLIHACVLHVFGSLVALTIR